MSRRKEGAPLPGLWGELAGMFTEPILAYMLGGTLDELRQVAENHRRPREVVSSRAADLCALHGVRPRLYTYAEWQNHLDVLIACTPAGWRAWSLRTTAWEGKNSAWIGNPEELRPVEDPDLLAQAREYGWPW